MKKPLKVLCLFDYKANTGYGRVSENIIPRIKKWFGNTDQECKIWLDIIAINWFGQKNEKTGILETSIMEDKWTRVTSALYSVPVGSTPDAVDDFGRNGFLWMLKHSNAPESEEEKSDPNRTEKGYDGIFIIQDASVVNNIVPLLGVIKAENKKNNNPDFKSIFYFPADFEMVDVVVDKLNFFDTLITYNEYSRNAVTKLRPELKGKLKVIPHGIDTNEFFPISNYEIEDFREDYFGENADKFIVLNLNRNQPRKDIPCTIFGFQEFKKSHPNALLYLHMNPNDPKGWAMRLVLMQTGLLEGIDFMFPPADKENHGFSVEELNKIYNACDVYVTTTKGEGWGLGVTEAMATGLPVICPMHTSFTEIGDNGNRAYMLENLYPICTADDSIIREQCDFMEVAEKLTQVYDDLENNPGNVRKKTDAAQKYVETSLDWDDIAARFAQYMKDTY